MKRSLANCTIKLNNLFEKDIWEAKELGIKPDAIHSSYYLNFSKLRPDWFKLGVKQFVRFQSATKTYSSCRCYITALTHFSNFIVSKFPNLFPYEISRTHVINFIYYLQTTNLGDTAKHTTLIHLRTFLELSAQENWLPFPKQRLLYHGDIPKPTPYMHRFIPEEVMTQLMNYLKELPEQVYPLVYILQETGRRIGEICTLPYSCIHEDSAKDFYLEVNEYKMRKTYHIPITKKCAEVIKNQQQYLQDIGKDKVGYLFVSKKPRKSLHVTARHVHLALNKLARSKEIRDANGQIWEFHPHQFRHTVGTRMINAGVSQPIVQRYLGHESPEMTSRYAHIHNQTLKDAFLKFQGELVNADGEIIAVKNSAEAKWLQKNILTQALPNGYCGLPLVQQRCPHANACLTCSHFRTDKNFLPLHEKQLAETKQIIEEAQKHGYKRQAEMNQVVKINLEKIINCMKGASHDA